MLNARQDIIYISVACDETVSNRIFILQILCGSSSRISKHISFRHLKKIKHQKVILKLQSSPSGIYMNMHVS